MARPIPPAPGIGKAGEGGAAEATGSVVLVWGGIEVAAAGSVAGLATHASSG